MFGDVCLICCEQPTDCDCTGGPLLEVECTCYEPQYWCQPGRPRYVVPPEFLGTVTRIADGVMTIRREMRRRGGRSGGAHEPD
jgi:hypothetical protein